MINNPLPTTLVFPRPKPMMDEYNDIVASGFERYPQRHDNYQQYLLRKKGYFPIKMDIEPTSYCNLSCTMCLMRKESYVRLKRHMTLREFKDIIDFQVGLVEVKIQGIGEPFLCPDFIEMVEYAHKRYLWVRSSTNATLLGNNSAYQKIIDVGINELQISIDGTNKSSYEKIRANAHFETVVDNCKSINEYCQKQGIEKTRMWVVLQKDNMADLHDFPEFAQSLGFRRVTISFDIGGFGDEMFQARNQELSAASCITQSDIDALLNQAERLDIDLSFWDGLNKYSRNNACPWPYERTFISAEGCIVPCCLISDPTSVSFGKVNDFKQHWFGDRYKKFREAHTNGELPSYCKNCYVGRTTSTPSRLKL